MTVMRWIALGVASLILAGCGSSAIAPPEPTPTKPTPPRVGACRNLTFSAVSAPSNNTRPVKCNRRHTAITVAVGSLVDAKHPTLTNVNAPAVQHRLAVSCPAAARKYLRASDTTFKLSQVVAIWFIPTPAQIKAGAHWYRCDVVALRGPSELVALPRTMRGVLHSSTSLDRWGTCANVAPSSAKFRRHLCGDAHHWRAVAIINVLRSAKYLNKATGLAASKKCRAVAKSQADNPLKYSWSFEWPNRQQWKAGDRFGLCWLPESN